MLCIVIDNTKIERCGLYVYALANHVPAFAIEGALRVVRNTAISSRLGGANEMEVRAEMQGYLRRILASYFEFGADIAEMERLGKRDVEEFLRLASRLRPEHVQRSHQGRASFDSDHAAPDVIDVEFEVVAITDGADLGTILGSSGD